MSEERERVFVYGTLRRGFPLHSYLEESSPCFVGRGTIQARLYDLGEFPGAFPSPSASEQVEGELFELNSSNDLRRLDEVEEHDPGHPERSLFLREKVKVQLEDGQQTQAWVYFLPHEPRDRKRIAGGDYAALRSSRK